MKNGRSVVAGFVGSAALWLGVAVAACSSSATSTTAGGADGGADVTTSQGGSKSCTTDTQCTPPPTTPANCATGTCNSVTGTCAFKAKDADGDGHAAANCKATNGVVVQDGDDCDDTDPNLYPGHPEACTTSGDGGVSRWPHGGATGACQTGQLTCHAGGVVSACTGEVPACPRSETCIKGACTGQCGPGETQCSGNSALQTCGANGTWGAPVQCAGGVCVEGDAGTGSGVASCGGACSPGQTQCQPGQNAVQTCSSAGAWGTPAACPGTLTCVQVQADAGTVASCGGGCGPGNTTCVGNSVVTCQPDGQYDGGTPVPCTGSTPACLDGACVACSPGATQCQAGANALQTCASDGTWGSPAVCGASTTCIEVQGASGAAAACGGGCGPGNTKCVGNSVVTCQADGQYDGGTPAACSGGTACSGGSCVPGCWIGGAFVQPGATANSGCEVCTPGSSATAWTNALAGTSCGGGEVCNNGLCGTQCDIGGTIYPSGAVNPSNPCQTCQPGKSTTGWTSTDGLNASCPGGSVCNGNPASCQQGCWIGGAFYAPGANPANSCQTCVAGGNAWTPLSAVSCNGNTQTCVNGTCQGNCSPSVSYPCNAGACNPGTYACNSGTLSTTCSTGSAQPSSGACSFGSGTGACCMTGTWTCNGTTSFCKAPAGIPDTVGWHTTAYPTPSCPGQASSFEYACAGALTYEYNTTTHPLPGNITCNPNFDGGFCGTLGTGQCVNSPAIPTNNLQGFTCAANNGCWFGYCPGGTGCGAHLLMAGCWIHSGTTCVAGADDGVDFLQGCH